MTSQPSLPIYPDRDYLGMCNGIPRHSTARGLTRPDNVWLLRMVGDGSRRWTEHYSSQPIL